MAFVTEKAMAQELAKRSPDLNKGSHPLDLPDSKAREQMMGGETSGVGNSDFDKSEEELDTEEQQGEASGLKSRNFPLSNSENVRHRKSSISVSPENQEYKVLGRGGGLSSRDIREEMNPNVDPELLVLGPDNDETGSRKEKRKGFNSNWTRRLELNKVGYESKMYDKLVDLSRVWTDSRTEITYKVGERPELDQIVFKNPQIRGKFGKDIHETSLTLAELKGALEKSEIRLGITRPDDTEDRRFVKDLQHLRLGAGVLKGEKVKVEFSKAAQEKKQEDINIFDLKLNTTMLEKYTDKDKDEKGQVEFFLGQLKHADIGWFGFELNKAGEIAWVTSVTKNGERTKIPAHLFRKVFNNVLPEGKGLRFVVPGVKKADILPGMNPQEVKEVMSIVKIDDKMLPDDTIYFIG